MKRILTDAAAVFTLAAALGAASVASAQPDMRRDAGPAQHNWRAGGRIAQGDWNRGAQVDWRARHLRAPPRGYEWRQVDGNYVLAALAGA